MLAQPCKTFEHIEELARDQAKKRQLQPPVVARFRPEDARRYVATVNLLWGTGTALETLHPTREHGRTFYYVLLAGERRYRSFRLLWERGCGECREARGQETPGRCFRRHFGRPRIEVRVCRGIPPLNALFLQLSENTHMPVPPHEEAQAYGRLFLLLRQAEPSFPMARLAREVGRSPDTVRRALRFHSLPDSIREAVERGHLGYGVAIEIARLLEFSPDAVELEFWRDRVLADRWKVDKAREAVDAWLKEKRSGQRSLLEIFKEGQDASAKRAHVRRTVQAGSIQSVWACIHYLSRVQQLFADGLLGKPGAPFSEDSPLRVIAALVERLKEMLPMLRELLSPRRFEETRAIVEEAHELFRRLPPPI